MFVCRDEARNAVPLLEKSRQSLAPDVRFEPHGSSNVPGMQAALLPRGIRLLMQSTTILTVTRDAEWLIGMRPFLHATGRGRLVVAETIREAERLLEYAQPRLIIVDWDREGGDPDAIASLLWMNSTQGRPASVMIVAQDYRVEEATVLFQLGVDEYVGVAEHREAMAAVLVSLTPETNGCSSPVWGHEYFGEKVSRRAGPAAGLGSIATAR